MFASVHKYNRYGVDAAPDSLQKRADTSKFDSQSSLVPPSLQSQSQLVSTLPLVRCTLGTERHLSWLTYAGDLSGAASLVTFAHAAR